MLINKAIQHLSNRIARFRTAISNKSGAGSFQTVNYHINWTPSRMADTIAYPVSRVTTQAASSGPMLVTRERKIVGYWLLGCAAMAFGTVVAGGVTRLTKSGLSMVDWNPFHEKPPSTPEEWEEEFEKYKQFPEFKHRREDMKLEDFRWIWHMEWGHRQLGRSIGAAFFIPATYFWYKGYFSRGMKRMIPVLGGLLIFQGALGWYMVKSGLQDHNPEMYKDPRVSHYRLAAHLSTAFLFYGTLLWTGLSQLIPPQQYPSTKSLLRLKTLTHATKAGVFITALSGAFVAGLDAGLIYNSFPKFADRWIPSDLLARSPVWKNFLENPTTVQFDHRILGIFTFTAATAAWCISRRLPLGRRAKMAANLLMFAALSQVALGISTLLYHVPTQLASAHQTGALTLFSIAVWLSHELKHIKRIKR